jgi:hypothetical protein
MEVRGDISWCRRRIIGPIHELSSEEMPVSKKYSRDIENNKKCPWCWMLFSVEVFATPKIYQKRIVNK